MSLQMDQFSSLLLQGNCFVPGSSKIHPRGKGERRAVTVDALHSSVVRLVCTRFLSWCCPRGVNANVFRLPPLCKEIGRRSQKTERSLEEIFGVGSLCINHSLGGFHFRRCPDYVAPQVEAFYCIKRGDLLST